MNMKMSTPIGVVAVLLIHGALGFQEARAARPEFAIAGGYSGATTDVDTANSDRATFNGIGIAGRVNLRKRWGLQLNHTWVDSNDRLVSGDELSFRALHLHAFRLWRPARGFRPYLKFGLMSVKFEADAAGGGRVRSDDLAPSIGGGFEWGSKRVGVFFDGGFAPLDVELSGDVEESVFAGNTTVGLFYRFGQKW